MKTSNKLNLKKLNREVLKSIDGGAPPPDGPIDGDGCKWPERMNSFGRCSIFG